MGGPAKRDVYNWRRIPFTDLEHHPDLRIPFRLWSDATEMGRLMAHELGEAIAANNATHGETRAIIPCGPSGWYQPFADLVNSHEARAFLLADPVPA